MPTTEDLQLRAHVAKRLRQGRAHAGYSVAELSAFCGLSESTIRRLERGQSSVRVRTIYVLALALGTKIQWWCEDD